MKSNRRDIQVYIDWEDMQEPFQMGTLHSERVRGKETFSFTYQEEWLRSSYVQLLDPDLELFSGIHFLRNEGKPNFGLFLDSSPDRWGRVLMRRREAALARKEERPERNLFETDYLLGVYDLHRMGALRFKLDEGGPFINNDKAMQTPPWTSIRKLESISLKLESEDVIDDPEYLNWLNLLLAPGSSLGGARPKASILDNEQQLWIAKFPSLKDDADIGAWEIVVHDLARAAGITVADARTKRFSSKHHTFLTKRFDRTEKGQRIHFASAMTMLGYIDGQNHTDGVSYLELVEFLLSQGANVDQDLMELWKRIVFNICVSNTDDHLRNHGFLLRDGGWVLSPAFDMNPVETGTGLSLNISENDNALDVELAMDVHEYFRLKTSQAKAIVSEVKKAVLNWRERAQSYHISRSEQELKAGAFRRAE